MSWGPLLVNLAVTAGLVAVLMLATFLYAMRTRVHAIMDTIWPLGFVLTAVWGLRLGAHIYARNRGQSRTSGTPRCCGATEGACGCSTAGCGATPGTRTTSAMPPVYMTNMLVRHTGKRLLEKHMARSRGRRTPITFGAPVASSPVRRAERMAPGQANRI